MTHHSALVVAPHPDDEVFGAAGLIAAKRERNAAVSVVYLTGGGASHLSCCTAPADRVVAHRRELAIRAAAMLGVQSSACVFMDFADGSLPAPAEPDYASVVSRLAEILDSVGPAEIYCTHPMDVWPDHVAASSLVRAAARLALPQSRLFEYLVWAPLNLSSAGLLSLPWSGASLLKIGPRARQKTEAIRCYLAGCAPCGHPWVGNLPPDFLKLFDWQREVFFDASQ